MLANRVPVVTGILGSMESRRFMDKAVAGAQSEHRLAMMCILCHTEKNFVKVLT